MQSKISFQPVGFVRSSIHAPCDHKEIKKHQANIVIDDAFINELTGINACTFVDVLYYFHLQDDQKIWSTDQKMRGAFANRSPVRPVKIGICTVRLLSVENNVLLVEGFDALDGSPVLDIKSTDTSVFAFETEHHPVHIEKLKSSPRIEMNNSIFLNDLNILMIRAAQMHGHYCPGLAMGVMAATKAMNLLEADSDGMEDVLAITETNNCFSDGIQFVTGCTFGNNALIFKDLGKIAFTLTHRDGNGIRIRAKNQAQQIVRDAFPDYSDLYQKVVAAQNRDANLLSEYRKSALQRAFGTLSIPFEELFEYKRVKAEVPSYAPSHSSVVCATCGELTMATRSVLQPDHTAICFTCAGLAINQLNGSGIHSNR